MGLGFVGLGIAPEISAKTIQGYFAGKKTYPEDELKDYLQ